MIAFLSPCSAGKCRGGTITEAAQGVKSSQGVKNCRVALFFHEDRWGNVDRRAKRFALPAKQRNLGQKSPI